jgi:hypothetical protein
MLRLPRKGGILASVAFALCLVTNSAAAVAQGPTGGGIGCDPSAPVVRSNDELTAGETFQRAITDVRRLGIAVEFCELRADTLTLVLGEGAFTAASTDYNLSRLFAAYRALTEYSPTTALELRFEDRVVGWYTVEGVTWLDRPAVRAAVPRTPAGEEEVVLTEEERRRGIHFSAGAGGGSFDRQCRGCEIESKVGVSGFLSVGRWLGSKSVIGVEGAGWMKDDTDRRRWVYSAMAHVTRYAGAASGLFLRAGAGLVGYSDDFDFSATALGFSGRLGYEFGGGKARVLPYVGYVRSFDGTDLKRDGEDVDFNFVISQLQFGVGVTIY